MTRVSLVIRDIKSPERVLLKKSIDDAHHLVEKLTPNIGHHLVADPLHAVGISVGTEAAHGHDRWDCETDQDNRIDFWPVSRAENWSPGPSDWERRRGKSCLSPGKLLVGKAN